MKPISLALLWKHCLSATHKAILPNNPIKIPTHAAAKESKSNQHKTTKNRYLKAFTRL